MLALVGVALLLTIVAAVILVVGAKRVHFVGGGDQSMSYRPATYGPARQDSGARFHGTHFSAASPPGYARVTTTDSLATAELLLKQVPVSQPNPGIIVSAQDAPANLPVEAYADIDRGHETDQGNAAGPIQAATLAGTTAQTYEVTHPSGVVDLRLICIRGGVVFTIEAVAPRVARDQAQAAFKAFSQSWVWE